MAFYLDTMDHKHLQNHNYCCERDEEKQRKSSVFKRLVIVVTKKMRQNELEFFKTKFPDYNTTKVQSSTSPKRVITDITKNIASGFICGHKFTE